MVIEEWIVWIVSYCHIVTFCDVLTSSTHAKSLHMQNTNSHNHPLLCRCRMLDCKCILENHSLLAGVPIILMSVSQS